MDWDYSLIQNIYSLILKKKESFLEGARESRYLYEIHHCQVVKI